VRQGNTHINTMLYQLFDTADFPIILAVGTDNQFNRFCHFVKIPEVAE
jgi:crotonobetainyl-CoA:carnitine CoA-transferase CaiB-like acyl-CoA transferase